MLNRVNSLRLGGLHIIIILPIPKTYISCQQTFTDYVTQRQLREESYIIDEKVMIYGGQKGKVA